MTLYTSDGSKYIGMDAETVTRLRSELGRLTAFITQEEFDALIQAQGK